MICIVLNGVPNYNIISSLIRISPPTIEFIVLKQQFRHLHVLLMLPAVPGWRPGHHFAPS